MREEIFAYASAEYGTEPEYLWPKYPDCAVLRRGDSRKCYGVFMNVSRGKLGLRGEGAVDVLNVKIGDPIHRDLLLEKPGILPPYHMAKTALWVSLLLDGTLSIDEIFECLDISYNAASTGRKK